MRTGQKSELCGLEADGSERSRQCLKTPDATITGNKRGPKPRQTRVGKTRSRSGRALQRSQETGKMMEQGRETTEMERWRVDATSSGDGRTGPRCAERRCAGGSECAGNTGKCGRCSVAGTVDDEQPRESPVDCGRAGGWEMLSDGRDAVRCDAKCCRRGAHGRNEASDYDGETRLEKVWR